jgi:hypothetical protein
MRVLIGSQALDHYGRLKNRKPYDWDLLTLDEDRSIKHNQVVLDMVSTHKEPTNKIIYEYCLKHAKEQKESPLGLVLVAPLEILKVLKLASFPVEKEKHYWDLEELKDVELSKELLELVEERTKETVLRVSSQKDKFFNKYNVKRFFEHDQLHLYVSPTPAYLRVLDSDDATTPNEAKFSGISLQMKKRIVWEECLVLGLERSLIPQVKAAPMLIEVAVERFQEASTTSDPALAWLGRLAHRGKLKDHPDWLADWVKLNYQELFSGYAKWWEESVHNLPKEFWAKLYASS